MSRVSPHTVGTISQCLVRARRLPKRKKNCSEHEHVANKRNNGLTVIELFRQVLSRPVCAVFPTGEWLVTPVSYNGRVSILLIIPDKRQLTESWGN